jgi:group I intron endonuclease
MNKTFGVYELVINTDHGKMFYVGSTAQTFKKRYQQHLNNLTKGIHHNHYLQNLWNKYKNIEFRILEVCDDRETVALREQYWYETKLPDSLINHGSPLPNPCLGTHHSEETRKKLSISHTNPSPEIRKRYSESHIGKKLTPEQKEKIASANRGRKRSPEFCKRLSEIKKKQSKETKRKISIANTGNVPSKEHRKAMSQSQRKRFKNPKEVEKARIGTLNYFQRHKEQKTHTRLPDDIWAEDLYSTGQMKYSEAYEYLNSKIESGEMISLWVFDQGIRKKVFRKVNQK